jgi:hypothetical protein
MLYSKVEAIVKRLGIDLQKAKLDELPAKPDKSCAAFIVDLTHHGDAILALPIANDPNLVRVGIAGHLEKKLIDQAQAAGFEVIVRSTLDSRLTEILRRLAGSS